MRHEPQETRVRSGNGSARRPTVNTIVFPRFGKNLIMIFALAQIAFAAGWMARSARRPAEVE